jgi:CheY-like chemotaxis protein
MNETAPQNGSGGLKEAAMSDKTVLLVDDQVDFLDAMQRALELDGYDVVRAENATQALQRLEAARPVCLLVDHRLADGASGTDLVRTVRQRHGSSMVIVMCTAHVDPAHQDAAERAGVDLVLPKPIAFDRLRTILPPI